MAIAQSIIDGEEFYTPTNISAKYVHKKPYGTAYGNLKVYIPSVMPNITMGEGKVTSHDALSKSIFCNASDCAVTPMAKVSLLNYITAKQNPNSSFQCPHMDYGASIIVHSEDHDFQGADLTATIDPSTYHT